MAIEKLPETVIAQIAAGEVVERPASVVKELLENALDAGASNVHVAIQGGGQRSIRISDNGSGISGAEIDLAVQRHATSKLRSIDDLTMIKTLGFRGEALSSITSVSQTTLVSRHRDEPLGTRVRIEGGVVVDKQSAGAPAGTVISVENLFYNTPARLKFLKKEITEKRHINALVTRYAMAYPDVRFTLEQDGREAFRTSGSGQLADVIVRTLGLENFRQMLEVAAEDPARDDRPAVRVFGYTSAPEYHRSDRTQITLFVNGRWVQDSSLNFAVIQAYHNLLADGRYPIAVLMIELPMHEVDVNVHPTKAEVRFRDPNAVFAAVQRAVRQAVLELVNAPDVNSGYRPRLIPERKGGGWFGEEDNTSVTLEDAGQSPSQRSDPTAIPVGMGAPIKPRTLPVLRVVGQIGAMYIVTEGPAGMYLVDQNAAHERVLYDALTDAVKTGETPDQKRLEGVTIDLMPDDASVLEKQLDLLNRIGVDLEAFGPNTYRIRRIPTVIERCNPVEILDDVVSALHDKSPDESVAVIAVIARQGATRSGQVLSHEEMQAIIRSLERCESPLECPDGRPTLIQFSGDRLAREFNRRT